MCDNLVADVHAESWNRISFPNGKQSIWTIRYELSFCLRCIRVVPDHTACIQTGKKKIKAVTRALQKAHRSPRPPSIRHLAGASQGTRSANLTPSNSDKCLGGTEPQDPSTANRSAPIPRTERQPLRTPGFRSSQVAGSYGSIVATPPSQDPGSDALVFELPDPAIDPDEDYVPPNANRSRRNSLKNPSPIMTKPATFDAAPARVTDGPSDQKPSLERRPISQSSRGGGLPKVPSGKQLLRHVFSHTEGEFPGKRSQAEPYSELDRRQDDFFGFLDGELHKIDSFYQMKEQEATDRLQLLRQQLHIMRDQRIQDIMAGKRAAKGDKAEPNHKPNGLAKLSGSRLKDTLTGRSRFGKNSETLAEMTTPVLPARDREFIINRRDFMPRQEPANNEVPYRSAKKKLKHALQEYYRGVELLKGYAYLNRTAFRKINKKYDKAVSSRPPLRYMSEKVNKAAFVQSEVVESLMVAAEDLYARYFERGNRKIAATKLRHTIKKSGDYSPSTFRAGFLLMGGVLLAIQALVYAVRHTRSGDALLETRTSYLLQVGGTFPSCATIQADLNRFTEGTF